LFSSSTTRALSLYRVHLRRVNRRTRSPRSKEQKVPPHKSFLSSKNRSTQQKKKARPPRPRAGPEAAPARLEAPADRVSRGQGHHVDPGEEARGKKREKPGAREKEEERELKSSIDDDDDAALSPSLPLPFSKKKKTPQLKSLPVDHGAPSASSPLREVALRVAQELRRVPSWDRETRHSILAAAADEAAARATAGGGGARSASAPPAAPSAALGGGGLVEAAQRAEEAVLMQALARARASSRAGGGGTTAAAAGGAARQPQQQRQQQQQRR